jgi:hypothetical protein
MATMAVLPMIVDAVGSTPAIAAGDAANVSLLIGQDAGLIRDIPAAGELGERIVAEAEALLENRLLKPVWVS